MKIENILDVIAMDINEQCQDGDIPIELITLTIASHENEIYEEVVARLRDDYKRKIDNDI